MWTFFPHSVHFRSFIWKGRATNHSQRFFIKCTCNFIRAKFISKKIYFDRFCSQHSHFSLRYFKDSQFPVSAFKMWTTTWLLSHAKVCVLGADKSVFLEEKILPQCRSLCSSFIRVFYVKKHPISFYGFWENCTNPNPLLFYPIRLQ